MAKVKKVKHENKRARAIDWRIVVGVGVAAIALLIGYNNFSAVPPTPVKDNDIKMPKDWSVLEIAESEYGKLIAFKGPQFRLLSCGRSFLGTRVCVNVLILGGIWEDDYLSSVFTTFPIESAVYFANPAGTQLLQM